MAFAVTLVVAVLLSGLAEETVLSVAVLFLGSGFMVGSGWFGAVPHVNPHLMRGIAELALFSVLFTDGMKTGGLHRVRSAWRLPARALLFGMPLTICGIGLLGHYLTGLNWAEAFLVGAALSPTDPVFVAAIFRFEAVPEKVKRFLNVESGMNDGLALPVVMLLLAYTGARGPNLGVTIGDLALGTAIGFVFPWLGIRLERTKLFRASGLFHPLNAFALGLLVLATCYVTGANLFLGAFSAGISVATFGQSFMESFHEFGELVTELLKLAALLVFGVVIAPRFFTALPWPDYMFILLAVFAVRFAAILASMPGSGLSRRETMLVGWFGPKGFASVVYGLLIFQEGSFYAAHLIALAVAASIVVYSSTDILVGRWYQGRVRSEAEAGYEQRQGAPPFQN
jgi:sodium/hydrogen antiporter